MLAAHQRFAGRLGLKIVFGAIEFISRACSFSILNHGLGITLDCPFLSVRPMTGSKPGSDMTCTACLCHAQATAKTDKA
jgi:hypothetical protein